MRGFVLLAMSAAVTAGCTSAPPAAKTAVAKPSPAYPARPSAPPPAFKVFHHTADSVTLVTRENASDEEVASLVWELRDAAHARTLNKLDTTKVAEKMVEDRKPIVWFHIYRGTKCAAEKYASGAPPCGGSYHAAADFTYGDYVNHEWDNGVLLHEGNETQLWDANKPYVAPGS